MAPPCGSSLRLICRLVPSSRTKHPTSSAISPTIQSLVPTAHMASVPSKSSQHSTSSTRNPDCHTPNFVKTVSLARYYFFQLYRLVSIFFSILNIFAVLVTVPCIHSISEQLLMYNQAGVRVCAKRPFVSTTVGFFDKVMVGSCPFLRAVFMRDFHLCLTLLDRNV